MITKYILNCIHFIVISSLFIHAWSHSLQGILEKASKQLSKAHQHTPSRSASYHYRRNVLIDNQFDSVRNDRRHDDVVQDALAKENDTLIRDSMRRKNVNVQVFNRRRGRRGHSRSSPIDYEPTIMVSLDQQIHQSQSVNLAPVTTAPTATSTNESLWPPWPFNLILKPKSHMNNNQHGGSLTVVGPNGDHKSGASKFFTYLQQRARGGFVQMQQMGNALSFHLPPAAPPLLLLAILPTKLKPLEAAAEAISAAASSATTSTPKVPQISYYLPNRIAKTLSLIALGTSILCWADYEVRNKKRLTPIPLFCSSNGSSSSDSFHHRSIRNVILPPFLPPSLPPIELDPVLGNPNQDIDDGSSNIDQAAEIANNNLIQDFFDSNGNFDMNIPRIKSSIDKLLPRPQRFSNAIRSWQRMMRIKQRDDLNLKRRKIMDRLLLLQQLKKREREKLHRLKKFSLGHGIMNGKLGTSSGDSNATVTWSNGGNGKKEAPLGYALVTGASLGIGRALAVELARWEVPLILVARNEERLLTVANEIKTAYGIDCCVIAADLSKPDTAKKLHKATTDAGLRVDFLINNAGVYNTGELVDAEEQDFKNMINVNVGTLTELSYLYGKDMKRQRRGRILFVSSVVGATPGGAGVATYAATKAYEKSLSQSMGRELEKYGVGVTCIMPGAVKGTSFSNGSTGEAACFKFPFYAMETQNIAERGIRAMLAGDSEVIPGWHNRLFLKVVSPVLPQRLTSSVVGFSFSPLVFGVPTLPWKRISSEREPLSAEDYNPYLVSSKRPPPLILELPNLEHDLKMPQVSMPENISDEGQTSTEEGTREPDKLDNPDAAEHQSELNSDQMNEYSTVEEVQGNNNEPMKRRDELVKNEK